MIALSHLSLSYIYGGSEKSLLVQNLRVQVNLSAESVEGTSLAFQGVDDIHGCDGLSLSVLAVGDGITDDILQKYLQNSTGFFVDQARDTLDTSTSSKTTDCWLGDSLDVITQHLAMPLGTPLSESLSSFTTSRHYDSVVVNATTSKLMKIPTKR